MSHAAPVSVYDAVRRFTTASRNQPGNQGEILKLLKHIPQVSQSLLPFPAEYNPSTDHEKDAYDLFQSLSKYLIDLLKHLVQSENVKDRPARSCECLENLILLGGSDYAKRKFSDVVSHETYLVIQDCMEYVENVEKNLEKIQKNIDSLVRRVKPLVFDMIEALFLCEAMNLTYTEQMSLISSTILEKLSTELLTVIDALKESAIKSSCEKVTNYLEAQPISSEDSLDSNNLILLGKILDSFLTLEMDLQNGCIARIEKARNGSERLKKSSLKQRLPDILRSSQEGSWMRSLYRYGDWDWQEVLRDVGAIIANTISKCFEELQTIVMNPAKKSLLGDDSRDTDDVPSLSSQILPGLNTPKRSIRYFKETLNLITSLLPYGVVGSHYKPLSSVLSCYTDECTQILRMMKSCLTMLLDDFPEKTTPTTLLFAVSTCEDVTATLSYCTLNIDTEVRAPFQGSFQLYQDLQNTLKSAIVQHICARMRGCILHDAEGNHFSDPKEFADGERCSYALENWKRFLKRLWKNMDYSVSISSRNKMFSEIFMDSLLVLKMRYLHCHPSYNRTKQLCLDIPFIVSACEEFLAMHYRSLDPDARLFSETDSQQIKSACIVFRSIMALVSGPLDTIQQQISSYADKSRKEDIQSENVKEEIPIELLKYTGDDVESLTECMVALLSDDSSLLYLVIGDDFKKRLTTKDLSTFHNDTYLVLASGLSLWSPTFFNCALASVKGNFSVLLEKCTPADPASYPYNHAWQKVFIDNMDQIMCQSLSSAISYLCHPTWSSIAKNLISTLSSDLQCSVVDVSRRDEDTENHIMAAIVLIFQSLTQSIFLLPEWLVNFLDQVNSKFKSETNVEATDTIISADIIIKSAERVLLVPDIWEEHCHMEFTKEGLNIMETVSTRLLKLYKRRRQPTSPAEELVSHFCNSFIEELANCSKLIPQVDYKYSRSQLLQECNLEVVRLQEVQPDAYESLKRIKKTLAEQYEWLKKECNARGQLKNSVSTTENIDWEELCKVALSSLEWRAVRNIIYHRWEMKTGAALTDKQVEIVEKIMRAFNKQMIAVTNDHSQ